MIKVHLFPFRCLTMLPLAPDLYGIFPGLGHERSRAWPDFCRCPRALSVVLSIRVAGTAYPGIVQSDTMSPPPPLFGPMHIPDSGYDHGFIIIHIPLGHSHHGGHARATASQVPSLGPLRFLSIHHHREQNKWIEQALSADAGRQEPSLPIRPAGPCACLLQANTSVQTGACRVPALIPSSKRNCE